VEVATRLEAAQRRWKTYISSLSQCVENLKLLATAFYLAGGRIKGATQLHKLVFLIQEEVGLGRFQFQPSKYGLSSPDLEKLIGELEARGRLKTEEVEDGQIGRGQSKFSQ